MEKFIKTYSDVPNGFVDDFFNIKGTDSGNKFNINLDIVSKWLTVQKVHLKRLLINNFEKDYDYVIEFIRLIHSNGKGSTRKENIFLTSDCFKELCMLSQTRKAREVRKYFLSVEKLLSRYHHYIETNLRSKIGLLENNQRPKYNIKSGVIYILNAKNMPVNEDYDLYKIGKAKDIDHRLGGYNTGKAYDIEPLFILEVNDINRVEVCIKNLVKQYKYRKGREIYQISLDLLKRACIQCNELLDSFDQSIKKIQPKDLDNRIQEIHEIDADGDLVIQIHKD